MFLRPCRAFIVNSIYHTDHTVEARKLEYGCPPTPKPREAKTGGLNRPRPVFQFFDSTVIYHTILYHPIICNTVLMGVYCNTDGDLLRGPAAASAALTSATWRDVESEAPQLASERVYGPPQTSVCVYMYMCIHAYVYIHIYTCICIYLWVHMKRYICNVYVCMYTETHICT